MFGAAVQFWGERTDKNELPAMVDGVSPIASHSDVHCIVCYQLTAQGEAEMRAELLIPGQSLADVVAALTKVKP